MTKKPDFATQFPLLRFPLYELTPTCWSGERSLSSRTSSTTAFEDAGPLSEVNFTFGVLTPGAVWEEVRSSIPGADPRKLEQVTRDALGASLAFGAFLRHEEQGAVSERLPSDHWALSHAAELTTCTIPINGTAVEFLAAACHGFYSASADLPTARVTVNGMLSLEDVALRTVTDIAAYARKRQR